MIEPRQIQVYNVAESKAKKALELLQQINTAGLTYEDRKLVGEVIDTVAKLRGHLFSEAHDAFIRARTGAAK